MDSKEKKSTFAWLHELKRIIDNLGVSRVIVFLFFVLLIFLTEPQELPGTISNTLKRVGMHGILVLAMVPSIRAGLGPNFSVPFGILSGLLGGLIAVEFNVTGLPGLMLALACSLLFAFPCGLLFGFLMNRVHKSEMMIATYFGYAIVAIMCIGWLILPFKNDAITWSMGKGLRNTINLEPYFGAALNNLLMISVKYGSGDVMRIPVGFIGIFAAIVIGTVATLFRVDRVELDKMSSEEVTAYYVKNRANRRKGIAIVAVTAILFTLFYLFAPDGGILGKIRDALTFSYVFNAGTQMEIPTGTLLFFGLCCGLMAMFNKSRTGIAMYSIGNNPDCARASGLNVHRYRMIGAVMSNMIVAVGILVYAQSFGFLQLYNAPLNMCFPPIAAILIGGASIKEANVKNVLIGVLLFQGILTMGPTVASRYLAGIGQGVDPTEIVRIIITNGIILYALAKAGGASNEK